jgi:site-specific recombinase XerD
MAKSAITYLRGPIFLKFAGKPLCREVLFERLHSALSSCGFNPNLYCGHSFRIGAATTALKAGISDAKINMLGQWESSAYQTYLRTYREELASVCSVLANSSDSP